MKSRGLEQVELFLSDSVVGMKTALAKTYPQAHFQRCLVHVIRNLKDIEPDLLVFYNYPKQIRASIYSTNMIESFNNVIKRKAKPKAEFPTEQLLDTFIGIQAMSYNERYFNRIHKGFGQVQDTLESYFD